MAAMVAATASRTGRQVAAVTALLERLEVDVGLGHVVGGVAQLVGEVAVGVVHDQSSRSASSGLARSVASARLAWDLTVPGLMPMRSAMVSTARSS